MQAYGNGSKAYSSTQGFIGNAVLELSTAAAGWAGAVILNGPTNANVARTNTFDTKGAHSMSASISLVAAKATGNCRVRVGYMGGFSDANGDSNANGGFWFETGPGDTNWYACYNQGATNPPIAVRTDTGIAAQYQTGVNFNAFRVDWDPAAGASGQVKFYINDVLTNTFDKTTLGSNWPSINIGSAVGMVMAYGTGTRSAAGQQPVYIEYMDFVKYFPAGR